MDDETFWHLIDRARGALSPDTPSADPERLRTILARESDETVAGFGRRFREELLRLNRWELWGAGYVISGGMSDDAFHYFRSWLIGKGKAAVEQARAYPDGLAPYVTDPDGIDNELLEYVAIEVMDTRDAQNALDEIQGESGPDEEPMGVAFDEESVHEAFPKLAERFNL